MAIQITYFVHGSTYDNEHHIASGWNDVELSELGIKQAEEQGAHIDATAFDQVFCSDLKRAVKTAQIVFGTHVPITPDPRLRECNYGEQNGKPVNDKHPLNHLTVAFAGGESYADVQRRVADFLVFLRKNFEGKRIAIVSHQAPQLALDVLIKEKTWEEAFAEDWRKTHAFQFGWKYELT